MKESEFLALCGQLSIDPGVALENEKVKKALRALEDEEVERILREEF